MNLFKKSALFLSALVCFQCKSPIINANSSNLQTYNDYNVKTNDKINDKINIPSKKEDPLLNILIKNKFLYPVLGIVIAAIGGGSYMYFNNKNSIYNLDVNDPIFLLNPDGFDNIDISWPPSEKKRVYYDDYGNNISMHSRGSDLEHLKDCGLSTGFNNKIFNDSEIFLNSNAKAITNLPKAFYKKLIFFLYCAGHESKCNFQTFSEKFTSKSYGECKRGDLKKESVKHGFKLFIDLLENDENINANNRGISLVKSFKELFDENLFKENGWNSKEDFQKFLDTPILFAFSGCAHFCKAKQIFFPTGHLKDGRTVIKKLSDEQEKYVDILSVAGYEFRGLDDNFINKERLLQIKENYKIMMQQILNFAAVNKNTDIIFLPVGLGVFISHLISKDKITDAIIEGCSSALNDYQGSDSINLHICFPETLCEKIKYKVNNNKIKSIKQSGKDAYLLACTINEDPYKKSLIVNAGDCDWIVGLNPFLYPGQFCVNHEFLYQTSDEYLALHTSLSYSPLSKIIIQDNTGIDSFISTY